MLTLYSLYQPIWR